MNKHFKLVLLTALLTGTGITAFQLIWLYKTWTITENNFYTTASSLLQKSVDEYHNREIRIMLDQGMGTIPTKDSIHPLYEMFLSWEHPDVAEEIVTNMAGSAKKPPLNLDEIKTRYRRELLLHNIDIPVTLSRDTLVNATVQRMASGILNSNKGKTRITATFSNTTPYLIQQNAWPIGISFSLILFTIGSLIYMLRVIKRQQQLDTMKNNFISNMTHELRTPVTILRSTHEAIDTFGYINNPERTLRYLHANRQVLDQMDKNIDRILQIAKYENAPVITPTQINLLQLLTAITQQFLMEDHVAITLHYELPVEEVHIDGNMLEIIIASLIDNAVKYSNKPATINILAAAENNSMILEVTDNGIGIASANLPYIFHRFYRVPTGNVHNVKGFGIGLNYVQTLTRLLGGTITVKSKPGTGSSFRLQFPLQ